MWYTQSGKIKIYKTFTRPVATYGAVSWSLNKNIAKRLAAFQKKKFHEECLGGLK
jgi:hypothetical protein